MLDDFRALGGVAENITDEPNHESNTELFLPRLLGSIGAVSNGSAT